MSSGTNKNRIEQNNNLMRNHNTKLNTVAEHVSILSGLTKDEYNVCLEIADSIEVGVDYTGTTATAEDIVAGKVAYANGEKLVGTLEAGNGIFGSDATSITFSTDNPISRLLLKEIDLSKFDTSAVTSWAYAFWNYKNLELVKGFKPTKTMGLSWCFCGCSKLKEFPLVEGGEYVTDLYMTVQDCKSLVSINWFDTTNVTDMTYMCRGCSALVDFPLLNASKVRIGGLTDMFLNCNSLSDESLNNIMAMCANATLFANAAVGNKSLSSLGLSTTQRTRCRALSNYQMLLNAGWTA